MDEGKQERAEFATPGQDDVASLSFSDERQASRLRLATMHRGNRFRLMFGLPLLPEPAAETGQGNRSEEG